MSESDKALVYVDFDAYFADFDAEEQRELDRAEAALDLAILLYRARSARGLTQAAAARRSGLKQQAISRWERSHPNVRLDSLQRYLHALGYALDLRLRDIETGEEMGSLHSADVAAAPSKEPRSGLVENVSAG